MMKLEFIQLTGFEPTADEYREIEAEYIHCDINKKEFCKNWCKDGGARRLMRLRAAKIEELEKKLEAKEKQVDCYKDEINLLRAEIGERQNTIREKDDEIERIKQDWDSMLDECDRYRGIISRFKESFSALVEV